MLGGVSDSNHRGHQHPSTLITFHSDLLSKFKRKIVQNMEVQSLAARRMGAAHPRLFALIIGINTYKRVPDLHGAVADAIAMKDYLEKDLQVPSHQICILCNENASRSAIIREFQALQNNPHIQPGDPVLIFFAGHGCKVKAPPGWVDGNVDGEVEGIVSQDYDGKGVHFIPDRTIGELIEGIARNKGDNITVIFDCCHSGSGTRDPDRLIRCAEIEDKISLDLDQRICGTDARGSVTLPEFRHTGLSSHMLLAACGADETAGEINQRGVFSKALLKLLQSVGVEKLTYRDVLTSIDAMPDQNPQCEGVHQDRLLFQAKITSVECPYYLVRLEDRRYVMAAGSVHGVTKDATFAVYKDKDSLLKTSILGTLIAAGVEAFSTTMVLPLDVTPFDLPSSAVAVQIKALEGDLVLYVPRKDKVLLGFKAVEKQIKEMKDTPWQIIVVSGEEKKSKAHLEIKIEDDKLAFIILDEKTAQYGLTRIPFLVYPVVDDVRPILSSVARYYWHLNRPSLNSCLLNGVKIEFNRLKSSVNRFDNPTPTFRVRSPDGPNLYRDDGVIQLIADGKDIYGITITNDTAVNMFPYVFFFDNSDLSIQSFYMPPTAGKYRIDPPLQARDSLAIGYGSGGSKPSTYTLRDGQEVDVGYLKFIFTTVPVDLSKVPQCSPFTHHRGPGEDDEKKVIEAWSSILIPVVQHRFLPS
ncbi:hypothetical protein JAAARDRAFT_73132 [Jaapia argillacea MUCL 33604]|uniref:Peptidase C14 caspase domain-containing protein n=1 Tax=Jaapia argillacea MUCL 33604 TaxID=933084 RepID=A0A067PC28_9AGAM|nr:hypothetical protein JAAARDRAFT_73132 [Jaapia argillacea MUCL 33604]